MKTLLSFRKTTILGLSFATMLAGTAGTRAESGYVAHEWGTFTSVQGSDGVQLDWHAQQVSELPHFVFDWAKAGLQRADLMTKSVIVARQRMETPVIYFYTDHELAVDVSVRFPEGRITEWFPQADRVGPAMNMMAVTGAASPIQSAPDSRIDWSDVKIFPEKENSRLAALMPVDQSGSHYFAARATDSAYLHPGPLSGKKSADHEKFLFYRGVGNFNVPLQVFVSSARELTLSNTGGDPLAHLFVLNVHGAEGSLVSLDGLAANESRRVQMESKPVPRAELIKQIEHDMAEALVAEGLFSREATAMVNTWKDSWFDEEGVRVLYVLPRKWTDARLPLTLTPAPRELVRVMVGRSEVITPAVETSLLRTLNAAQQGDSGARHDAVSQFKKLGRFAEPALRSASRHSSDTNAFAFGYRVLAEAIPAK